MPGHTDKRDGYVRSDTELRLIDSSAVAMPNGASCGYLELLTEDGRLRLALSHTAAEDLLIDLQQLLAAQGRSPLF